MKLAATVQLLLLLLLLASQESSAHVCFLDFSSNGKATGVKFDTAGLYHW